MLEPYGLASQKLCYIPICKSWREKKLRMFLRMVSEDVPRQRKRLFYVLATIKDFVDFTALSRSKALPWWYISATKNEIAIMIVVLFTRSV